MKIKLGLFWAMAMLALTALIVADGGPAQARLASATPKPALTSETRAQAESFLVAAQAILE